MDELGDSLWEEDERINQLLSGLSAGEQVEKRMLLEDEAYGSLKNQLEEERWLFERMKVLQARMVYSTILV